MKKMMKIPDMKRTPRRLRRRGMSLLIVIMLVSVATVLSYTLLRGQTSAIHIQENADLRDTARHAAISGLTYGIQTMHTNDWGGVDSSETRALATNERFTVSFAAGDPSLTSGDANYGDYPYRVTVYSTGYVEDPQDTTRTASYTVRAVMRLIPRALSNWSDWPQGHPDYPTDWWKMEDYTVYQTHEQDVRLEIPCRLEGAVRFQRKLFVGASYPSAYNQYPWVYYMSGLYSMVTGGGPDYRPLNGPVCLYESEQDYPYYLYMWFRLRFDKQNMTDDVVSSDWQKPQGLSTYQIYPGGPVYSVEELSGTNQENASLQPDPVNNPLGLFYRDGDCELKGGVSIRGTLFCKGNVTIEGTVQCNSVDMPELIGAEGPVRLPVMTAENIKVEAGSSTSIEGLVAVFSKLDVKEGLSTLPFSITGRLITKDLEIGKRTDWASVDWDSLYNDYRAESTSTPFPEWCASRGLDPEPRIKIVPDENTYQYHWNDWDYPIYVPHDDDGGLRWEMLEWKEGVTAGG